MVFRRKARAETQRRRGDEANLGDVVQELRDDVDRLAQSVAELRTHLDASKRTIQKAVSESRSANNLAVDVAKAFELSLVDINALRRDIDAIRQPDE